MRVGVGLLFMKYEWGEAIIMPYVVALHTLSKLEIAPLYIIRFAY